MRKRLFLKFLALILMILASIAPVYSVGLGVSPAKLSYNNVLRGGYAQNELYISTDTEGNLTMFFEKNGEISEWITIEDNMTSIVVSRNSPKKVKIILMPPSDTASGTYTGGVRVITDRLVNPMTGIGSSVKAAFLVTIDATITGDEIKSCSGGGIYVSDAEIGFPLTIETTIKNDGNVRTSPQIHVNIWDKYQKEIVLTEILSSQSILPTDYVKIKKEIDFVLEEDQYWAEVKVPDCNFGKTMPINILEKGGISDKGDFIRIENKPWAMTKEIIPITAVFKNTGSRTVTAQFKGEILYEGEIVKIIDTDKISAATGEVIKLQTFFRPEKFGQYFVSGRIYYNNRLTSEKASVINVNPKNIVQSSEFSYIWYIIILILIGILVMLIMIKRKKNVTKHIKRY